MSAREPREAKPLAGGRPTAWATARDRLTDPEAERTHWLATLAADGART